MEIINVEMFDVITKGFKDNQMPVVSPHDWIICPCDDGSMGCGRLCPVQGGGGPCSGGVQVYMCR